MFLDADEIFDNCSGIIDFFNSGEYRKYNYATFVIRNLNENGTGSDFHARRLVKKVPGQSFAGAIHEHFSIVREPCRNLDDVALHYGYLYKDDSERIKKYDRNYSILLKKYEEMKDKNPMVYAEMYDTLATGFRQQEADEYLDKGIKWCEINEHPLLILMYCKKARHLLFEKQNEEALKFCEKYLAMSKNIRPRRLFSDIEIYAILATAYQRSQDHNRAYDTLVQLFEYYKDTEEGRLDTPDKMYGTVSLASHRNYISFAGQFLECCLAMGRYENAAQIISELSIAEHSEYREMYDYVISLEAELLGYVDRKYQELFMKRLDEYGRSKLCEYIDDISQKKKREEFEKLSVILKNNILNMINKGDKKNAAKFLDEYRRIAPSDKDIPRLNELIG